MLTAQLLHEWTSLLELTQRSSMEPHILGIRVHLLFQDADSLALTTPHLAHLLAEKAHNGYATQIEIDN